MCIYLGKFFFLKTLPCLLNHFMEIKFDIQSLYIKLDHFYKIDCTMHNHPMTKIMTIPHSIPCGSQ